MKLLSAGKWAFIAFIGLVSIPANASWIQLGSDIDGENAWDNSGFSVSFAADGQEIAVGAPNNDDVSGSGQVRVFSWNGTNWEQIGENVYGVAYGEDFGHSVSLSSDGSRMAVGAPGYCPQIYSIGRIAIYEWDSTQWVQVGSSIYGGNENDYAGHDLEISSDGNRIVLGLPGHDASRGTVRIYEWTGTDWIQMGSDIDGDDIQERFGEQVTISADGSRVAMSSIIHGANSGQIRIFEWSDDEWIQLGGDINGEAPSDSSGKGLDISADGQRVAIGASYNDGGGNNAGHVRIFEWSGTEWI
ncbi:MAG TPA: hypothetical protein PLV45_12210, partial [bacterium]|nr:hypothetical protein [bacterium]